MRRGWVVVLVLAAACYGPKPQAGAPCDPASPACPEGQVCIAQAGGYACEPPGTLPSGDAPGLPMPDSPGPRVDAAIDARTIDGPPGDLDGDGVPDTSDNCPTVPNPGQENEDGDKFGDVCDPCPPIADDNPPDADGDGVADACDPRPSTPGDKIVLFEGFHHGVPAWNAVGTWTAANDSVSIDSRSAVASLTSTITLTGHESVVTSVIVNAISTSTDASAGVVDTYTRPSGGHGIYCHVTNWPTKSETPLIMTELHSKDPYPATFTLVLGDPYLIGQRRDTTTYACQGAHAGTIVSSPGRTSTLAPTTPEVGIRVSQAQATFAWVMIVDN